MSSLNPIMTMMMITGSIRTSKSSSISPIRRRRKSIHPWYRRIMEDKVGMIFWSSSSRTRNTGRITTTTITNRHPTTISKNTTNTSPRRLKNNIKRTWYVRVKIPGGLLLLFGFCYLSKVLFHQIYTINESNGNNNEKSGVLPRAIPPEVLCVMERNTDPENCYNAHHHPSIPESNTNRSIIFIHVGKAGGVTITNAINNVPKSQLSTTIHGYIHADFPPTGRKDIIQNRMQQINYNDNNNSLSLSEQALLVVNQSTTFLYNLRHPYDRTKSWYSFVSPKNCNRTLSQELLPSCRLETVLKTSPDYIRADDGKLNYVKIFFHTCFPTLQDFAIATVVPNVVPIYNTDPNVSFHDAVSLHELQTGVIRFPTNDTTGNTLFVNCSNMVYHFIHGNRSKFGLLTRHIEANYQFYYYRTIDKYPNREIFVVRTNTLWNDLKQLDRNYLNGTGIFPNIDGTQYTHGSEQHQITTTRTTSSDGTKYLCCALRTELIYYKYLLFAASNLQAQDKQQTWQNDIQHCGFDTWYNYEQYCSNLRKGK